MDPFDSDLDFLMGSPPDYHILFSFVVFICTTARACHCVRGCVFVSMRARTHTHTRTHMHARARTRTRTRTHTHAHSGAFHPRTFFLVCMRRSLPGFPTTLHTTVCVTIPRGDDKHKMRANELLPNYRLEFQSSPPPSSVRPQ